MSRARVRTGERRLGSIGRGLCVLLSVGPGDDEGTARRFAARIATLRVLADPDGKMNLDLGQAGGAVLVVSQFTLHADSSRGHRPSFAGAASAEAAERLYVTFTDALRQRGLEVATGAFGARMEVELVNDGPVTLVLSAGEGDWRADAG